MRTPVINRALNLVIVFFADSTNHTLTPFICSRGSFGTGVEARHCQCEPNSENAETIVCQHIVATAMLCSITALFKDSTKIEHKN